MANGTPAGSGVPGVSQMSTDRPADAHQRIVSGTSATNQTTASSGILGVLQRGHGPLRGGQEVGPLAGRL
jgi:hypothetical protein